MTSNDTDYATTRLINVEYRLRDLARAFARVGNDHVAQEITAYANQLDSIREQIHSESGKMISDYIDAIGQNSVNVLEAALAGCIVGAQSKGEP